MLVGIWYTTDVNLFDLLQMDGDTIHLILLIKVTFFAYFRLYKRNGALVVISHFTRYIRVFAIANPSVCRLQSCPWVGSTHGLGWVRLGRDF